MQNYYKVVRVVDNKEKIRKLSFTANALSISLEVEYKYRQWAYANSVYLNRGFGLCVFDNLDDAEEFYDNTNNGDIQLWKCQIQKMDNHSPSKFRCSLQRYFCKDDGELIYLIDSYAKFVWPYGTVLVKAVKLTKLIQEKYTSLD